MSAVRAEAPAFRTPPARRPATTPRPSRQRLAVIEAPGPGWLRTVVVAGGVVLLALTLAIAIQGERIRTQERYDTARAQLARAQERNRDLRVAVAQAESPEVVLESARAQGMIEPGPVVAVPPGPLVDAPIAAAAP